MKVGVPKETKEDETRAALLPAGANALVEAGHSVFVEQGASHGAGVADGIVPMLVETAQAPIVTFDTGNPSEEISYR